MTRAFVLLAAAGAGAAAFGVIQAATPTRAPVCVQKQSGQVRMLLEGRGSCEPSELRMDWTVGGVAAIQAGAGIVQSTENGTARLSIDTSAVQARISDACREGSAIGGVAQDGTVSCVTPACSCPAPSRSKAVSGWLDSALMDYVGFPGQIITTLTIPEAGSWVVFAKADIMPHVNSSGTLGCRLLAVIDSDNSDTSWWYQSLDNGYGNLDTWVPMSLSLNVVHTFPFAEDVIFQCYTNAIRDVDGAPYPVYLQNIKITAIKVDDLTNTPLTQTK